jgi:hypothetical protein
LTATPYLVLEFLEGGSLNRKLQGTPLPFKEAARLVEVLARAVEAAHQKQIVHRDLKPANVMLGADGTPKVGDFGLAKKLDEAGQTQSGAVMGTPSYMAPEQAVGRTKEVGFPADIYALGAILYECLTGRPPFKAATAVETLQQVANEEPVPPRRLQPKLPIDLETICLKCLQKEPIRRYASATEFAEDLRRFQAGEVVKARPVGAVERGWRWCRRNPAMAVSLLAVALSLLATVVVFSFVLHAEPARQDEVTRARDEVTRARSAAGNPAVAVSLLAVALTLLATAVLSVFYWLHAEQARQDEATRARGEAAAKKEADEARRNAQLQLIDLCGASGLTAAREGDHSLALLWFARAVQLARDHPGQEELNRIRVSNWHRSVWLPEGTFAIPGFRHNLDRFRTLRFSPDGKYLLVTASTGDCLVWDRPRGRLVQLPALFTRSAAVAWGPSGGRLAVAGKEGRIHFLIPPGFHPAKEEVAAGGEIAVLAFSQDGRRLAWGGSEGARVWDLESKGYVTPLLAHPKPVVSLSFSAAGDLLATSARDLKARVFRVGQGDNDPLFPAVGADVVGESGSNHGGSDLVAPRFVAGDQVLVNVERTQQGTYTLAWRSATTGKLLSRSAPPDKTEWRRLR